tara:strand:+ start:1999 stop:3039 length:1041 start_codon:yes stop_codon:yes gene_type:complete
MSYTQLGTDDFVISADSISSTLWSNGTQTLSTFFTSSAQVGGSSGDFYVNVYDAVTTESIQFAIAYGNSFGSGSTVYNSAVNGKSPTSTIYGQYQNLVIGDENTDFVFGAITSSEFFALPIERARYKESIFLGSLSLAISSSTGTITVTDNSNYVTAVQFCEAGRVFQLITGSQGVKAAITSRNTTEGYTTTSGSYGWLLPDIGTIILNPRALTAPLADGGIAFVYSGSTYSGSLSYDSNTSAPSQLYRALSGSANFKLNSEETITSDFIFVRPRSSEYNYSENPSFISGSTGEVLYPSFINNPQVYITTVGLYNDTNELLAVAKLSRPLLKDFTKEALVRVKLDF